MCKILYGSHHVFLNACMLILHSLASDIQANHDHNERSDLIMLCHNAAGYTNTVEYNYVLATIL